MEGKNIYFICFLVLGTKNVTLQGLRVFTFTCSSLHDLKNMTICKCIF